MPVDGCFGPNHVAGVFFVPAANEAVKQCDGSNGIGPGSLHNIGTRYLGGYGRNSNPMATGGNFLGSKHHVAFVVRHIGVTVPELGDFDLLIVQLFARLIHMHKLFVKLAGLGGIKRSGWRWRKLVAGIQHHGSDFIPTGLNAIHVVGWSRLPARGVFGDGILGKGPRFLVVIST